MANVVLVSIFGILATIGGALWLIVELITYFPQTPLGFFLFCLFAITTLYIAKMMMRNFIDTAHT
jgi:hypothetical protein